MVPLAPHVQDYVVKARISDPCRRPREHAREQIHPLRKFSSRRASVDSGRQSPGALNGRFNVSTDDIHALLKPALRHRIILNFEAQADGRAADDLLEEIVGKTKKN